MIRWWLWQAGATAHAGKQQCTATVFDIDRDGIDDFVITERTAAPGVGWYRRAAKGWTQYVLDAAPMHIEAGSTFSMWTSIMGRDS